MGERETTILIRNVDNDLKRKFRVACADEERSMTKQLKVLMAEFVRRKEEEWKQRQFPF